MTQWQARILSFFRQSLVLTRIFCKSAIPHNDSFQCARSGLCAFNILVYLILTLYLETGAIILSSFQRRKRTKRLNNFSQSHRESKQESWDLNSGILAPELALNYSGIEHIGDRMILGTRLLSPCLYGYLKQE